MNLLPKWALVNPFPAIHDFESLTVIEQTARVYGAMQTLIDEYNAFAETANKQLAEFSEEEAEAREEFETKITKVMNEFTCSMNQYLKLNLDDTATRLIIEGFNDGSVKIPTDNSLSRMNQPADAAATGAAIAVERARINSLTKNSEAATEENAELVDIRVGFNGTEYPTAGEAVRAQAGNNAADISELKTEMNGYIATPPFEMGDIYVSGGTATYYKSSQRIRTKQNTTILLKEGTVVGFKDNSGKKFAVYIKNDDGTVESATGAWAKDAFTLKETGEYMFLLAYDPETDISNMDALTKNFRLNLGGMAETMLPRSEFKKMLWEDIENPEFELGDIYLGDGTSKTYYNSTARIRTKDKKAIHYLRGTVIETANPEKAVFKPVYQSADGMWKDTPWLSGSWMVPETGDYEIQMRYPTESTIESVANLASCLRIRNPYGVLVENTAIKNDTDVFKEEIEKTVDSVREKITSRAIVLGIVTDTHLESASVKYFDQTMENMRRVNDQIGFNAVCHLGDLINGYDDANKSKFFIQYAIGKLRNIHPNLFYVAGNHDNNGGAGDAERMKDADVYAYAQQFNEHYVHRSAVSQSVYEFTSSNYYYDFESFRIRLIMFDSCYYSHGFSPDTIEWIQNVMNTTPAGYKFVLLTHCSTEQEVNGGVALGNAQTFKNILADNKEKILCYIHGHTHYDCLSYVNEFAQIGICSQRHDHKPGLNRPDSATVPEREIGTVTQDCFEIAVILPDEGKVELVRFGAGEDRTVPFRNT